MNQPIQLCYPVTTLDGRELLPAGTFLTSDTMESLIRLAKKQTYTVRSLMAHGTIARDLDRICNSHPYCRIFSDPSRRKRVFDTMQRVELAQPLLDFYDYFKTQDPYTYRHILTVFALSLLMAQDLIENRKELDMEVAAAPSHDFGKVCVPLSVLKKSTHLEEQERLQLSHHVAAGYVLLSYYFQDANHPAAVTARDHHERRDGSGYPRGIRSNNRIVEIVAAGDVFDALITRRPYRSNSYEVRTALEVLTRQADRGALDEKVVQALIKLNREDPPCLEECKFSKEFRGIPPTGNHYSGALPCKFEKHAGPTAEGEPEQRNACAGDIALGRR